MGDLLPHRACAAVARRWRSTLPEGALAAAPAVLDVTVALLTVHRSGGGLDLPALMACPVEELHADVGTILADLDRRTGAVAGLLPIRHRAVDTSDGRGTL